MFKKAIVLALAGVAVLLPLVGHEAFSAPFGLIGGAIAALTIDNPFPEFVKRYGRTVLQGSVVLLGFSVDLGTVTRAGLDGLGLSILTISTVFGLGWALARALKVRPQAGLLISAGTAICGGSAIAAVAGATGAPDEDVAVAAGTVFGLNAIALLIFPPLGHAFGLGQDAFGRWAGIAIHDVASVVGAGAAYGPRALEVATAVKLSRVLFLIPVVLLVTILSRRNAKASGAKVPLPWFVGGFLLASALRSALPGAATWSPHVKTLATAGFALALLAIGLGLSRAALAKVGARPLILGALLWIFVSVAGLLIVR